MQIFNIMLSRDLGGIQQSFLDYSKMISMNGYKNLAIISKNSKIKSYVSDNTQEINNYFPWDISSIFQIKELIDSNAPNVIIAHGNRAIRFARIAKYFSDRNPIIIGVAHNYSYKELTKCDYIFSITNYMKEYLISKFYASEKIFLLPNTIDSKNYHFSPKNRNNNKLPTIGILARFVKKKGVDVAIKSLKKIIDKGENSKLIIGGEGEEGEYLKKLCNDLGLETNIDFVGWVKDKDEFFKNIDIFCLPSLEEPFGIIILEAMLSKTPIISTKSEGPREILDDNETALLVDINDPEGICNAYIKLKNDYNLQKQIIDNAYLRVLENYDIKNVAKIFKNYIEEIIKNVI